MSLYIINDNKHNYEEIRDIQLKDDIIKPGNSTYGFRDFKNIIINMFQEVFACEICKSKKSNNIFTNFTVKTDNIEIENRHIDEFLLLFEEIENSNSCIPGKELIDMFDEFRSNHEEIKNIRIKETNISETSSDATFGYGDFKHRFINYVKKLYPYKSKNDKMSFHNIKKK